MNDALPLTFQVQALVDSRRFMAGMVLLYELRAHVRENQSGALAEAYAAVEDGLSTEHEGATGYLAAHLFVARIAAFEVFLQEMIALVLRKHPRKIGKAAFPLSEILDAQGPEELVRRAAEQFTNELMYKKPLEYLDSMCQVLSIDRTPLIADWAVFIEAKARRDLGMHSGWVCNAVYRRKISEAGLATAFEVGHSVLPLTNAYLRNVENSLSRLAQNIGDEVFEKHWPEAAAYAKLQRLALDEAAQ
jgi:hypothetical protein